MNPYDYAEPEVQHWGTIAGMKTDTQIPLVYYVQSSYSHTLINPTLRKKNRQVNLKWIVIPSIHIVAFVAVLTLNRGRKDHTPDPKKVKLDGFNSVSVQRIF